MSQYMKDLTEAKVEIGCLKEERTESWARIAKLEALVAERDAMLGKRQCQNSRCNELNAARALLREVIGPKAGDWYTLERRVEAYFDACDKPGAPDAS